MMFSNTPKKVVFFKKTTGKVNSILNTNRAYNAIEITTKNVFILVNLFILFKIA
jgi:hypothetical protein